MDDDSKPERRRGLKRLHALAIASLALAGAGCANRSLGGDAANWTVEIGRCSTCYYPEQNLPFTPLADGDVVPVVLGPAGVELAFFDLRVGTLGGAPSSGAVIAAREMIGGTVVGGFKQTGADWVHAPANGGSIDYYVAKRFGSVFAVDYCCLPCSQEGEIAVTVGGVSGGAATARRRVLFRRTSCPGPLECCADATECPPPLVAQRCATDDGGQPDGGLPDLRRTDR